MINNWEKNGKRSKQEGKKGIKWVFLTGAILKGNKWEGRPKVYFSKWVVNSYSLFSKVGTFDRNIRDSHSEIIKIDCNLVTYHDQI